MNPLCAHRDRRGHQARREMVMAKSWPANLGHHSVTLAILERAAFVLNDGASQGRVSPHLYEI